MLITVYNTTPVRAVLLRMVIYVYTLRRITSRSPRLGSRVDPDESSGSTATGRASQEVVAFTTPARVGRRQSFKVQL